MGVDYRRLAEDHGTAGNILEILLYPNFSSNRHGIFNGLICVISGLKQEAK